MAGRLPSPWSAVGRGIATAREGRIAKVRSEAEEFLQSKLNANGRRVSVEDVKRQWVDSGRGSFRTLQRARVEVGLAALCVNPAKNEWLWLEPDAAGDPDRKLTHGHATSVVVSP